MTHACAINKQSGLLVESVRLPWTWNKSDRDENDIIELDIVAMPDDYLVDIRPGLTVWASQIDRNLVETDHG